MASAAANNLENKILWWIWIKWKQWQLFFCQRRHQSHGAGRRQQKEQNKQKNITQPFQRQRQSSVLCWLLQLRKIPVYADRYFFFLALAVTGLCKQQDVHLQQRHRHTLETVLLSPRASLGLSDWL